MSISIIKSFSLPSQHEQTYIYYHTHNGTFNFVFLYALHNIFKYICLLSTFPHILVFPCGLLSAILFVQAHLSNILINLSAVSTNL